MTRPLGQFFILVYVGLAAFNLLLGLSMFGALDRAPRTTESARFWSATVVALSPAILDSHVLTAASTPPDHRIVAAPALVGLLVAAWRLLPGDPQCD